MPKLTEWSSTQDQADASIWAHCLLLVRWLGGPDIPELLSEVIVGLFALLVVLLILLTFPISFPILAWFRRRAARREIAEWKQQHKEST